MVKGTPEVTARTIGMFAVMRRGLRRTEGFRLALRCIGNQAGHRGTGMTLLDEPHRNSRSTNNGVYVRMDLIQPPRYLTWVTRLREPESEPRLRPRPPPLVSVG